MNIAFQALLLILLYLPGALFIAALFGRLSKDQELPVISLSLTGRAAAALLSAGAFHALWLAGIRQLANWGFHIISAAKQFFILLSSSQQSVDYLQTDDWESRNLDCLFWYFASICAGAVNLFESAVHFGSRRMARGPSQVDFSHPIRLMPGKTSNPASKLKIVSIPCSSITAACTASRADSPLRSRTISFARCAVGSSIENT